MIIVPKKSVERVPWLQLYLNDLTGMASILESNCESIVVSGFGFELEKPTSIEEYEKLSDEQFRSLKIEGFSPDILIEQYSEENDGGMEVSIDKDEPVSLGLMRKIVDIISTRQRVFVEKYHKYNIGLVLFFVYFIGILFLTERTFLESYAIAFIMAAVIVHFLFSKLFRVNDSVIFEKKQSNKNYGFFQRKKDELTLMFISIVLGTVVGTVVTSIVNALND